MAWRGWKAARWRILEDARPCVPVVLCKFQPANRMYIITNESALAVKLAHQLKALTNLGRLQTRGKRHLSAKWLAVEHDEVKDEISRLSDLVEQTMTNTFRQLSAKKHTHQTHRFGLPKPFLFLTSFTTSITSSPSKSVSWT